MATRTTAITCKHHWIIESPAGASCKGTCKHCGAERNFPAAFSADAALWGDYSDGVPQHYRSTSLSWYYQKRIEDD